MLVHADLALPVRGEQWRGCGEVGRGERPGCLAAPHGWLHSLCCVTSAHYLIEPLEGSGRNAVVMQEVVSTAWQSSEFNDVFKWT